MFISNRDKSRLEHEITMLKITVDRTQRDYWELQGRYDRLMKHLGLEEAYQPSVKIVEVKK